MRNAHIPLAAALTLALLPPAVEAQPLDWCLRPEASIYETLDLKPGSGVKRVVLPRGMHELGSRETITLRSDGLLESIRSEYNPEVCTETYVRDDGARLLRRQTSCTAKGTVQVNQRYEYTGDGWVEVDAKGTEKTSLQKSGAIVRKREQNIDRTSITAPGSIYVIGYDSDCRKTGTRGYNEAHMAIGQGAVLGPFIQTQRTLKPSPSGWQILLIEGFFLKSMTEYGKHGFVVREEFFERERPGLPSVSRETSYELDSRGNWLTKKVIHRALREGGEVTVEEATREITYQ
jgi:hypothetical protein